MLPALSHKTRRFFAVDRSLRGWAALLITGFFAEGRVVLLSEIEAIGAREGWRAKTFGRGMRDHKPFFHVIEFWLENRLMIEVVSPEMEQEYKDFLKNARTEVMGDPEAVRLMRATHVKEPA